MFLLAGQPAPTGLYPHEFVFKGSAKTVAVAGQFNGWNPNANPLIKGDDGVWRGSVEIPMGSHFYKLVIDGSRWIVDPGNGKSNPDESGNVNSVVTVLPPDFSQPASAGDGEIALSALCHRPDPSFFWTVPGKVSLALTARAGDLASASILINGKEIPMRSASKGPLLETFRGEAPWDGRTTFTYAFLARDGRTTQRIGKDGAGENAAPFALEPSEMHQPKPPKWAAGKVFYQIFPDRFENGSRSNDGDSPSRWDDKPTGRAIFGGDFAGIEKRISYLKDLGVQGIYLNPIFVSPSNHRYDTTDYLATDPRLGTNEEFARLSGALRANGMRVILDGVFNHTSTEFAPFKSIRTEGQASAFKDWYYIKSYPVTPRANPPYEAWNNHAPMPKVNLANPEARKYMLGVADFWQKEAHVDGWRLDVANEVSMDFWRAFRGHLKSVNPNAWIVGEHWLDASPWLRGDQWDSVMGYQFRSAMVRFAALGLTKPSECLEELMGIYQSYPPEVSNNILTLLGSHDTLRFLTACGGDRNLAAIAAVIQLTWPGTPCIYYGDELGMEGSGDPDNRRGMAWSKVGPDNKQLGLYKRLINLRRNIPALSSGRPVRLESWDSQGAFAYGRESRTSKAIVFVNRSGSSQTVTLTLPSSWKRWFSQSVTDVLCGTTVTRPEPGKCRLTLAPYQCAILSTHSSAITNLSGDNERK